MRFESATVPAAVMPDRAMHDDGFRKYLPLFANPRMGRLPETGTSQKTCQKIIFKASGKRSVESQNDSLFPYPGSKYLKLIMKRVVLYTVIFLSINVHGQLSHENDTILIREVEIRAKPHSQEYIGFKATHIDSSLIRDFTHRTLADLLSRNSVIHIKTYGSGGLATSSFRGTGPGHTQISWNDINLNSPMLGQFDLTLVPAGLIDNINIYYGGGSMGMSSGGFGGLIDLETNPEWDGQEVFYLNPSIGSFGNYSGLAKIRAGSEVFQSVTKAYMGYSENNFRYLINESELSPVWETRKNSQASRKGFIQELYFKKSHSNISARVWYHSASRNLPAPIIGTTMNPPEKQFDESLRTIVAFEQEKWKSDISITAAYISDKLNYRNELALIDSRNHSERIILKGILERSINKLFKIEIALNNELSLVKTNNYAGDKIRNLLSADAVAEADLAPWLAGRIMIRELLHDDSFLTPDFSASTEIRPFREKYYFIKTSFSKNSKIPSINDMYWSPGGNPDLTNETGYTSEITWEMTNFLSGSLKIKNDITLFRNNISDMIQWHPGEFSYWEAANIGNIVTSGLESGMNISYSFQKLKLMLNAEYACTRAFNNGSTGENLDLTSKQLIYIPANQMNALVRLDWRQFYAGFSTDYTGKRYITADNSLFLPKYSVSDLNLGTSMLGKHASCELSLVLENLFNVSYQNISYYPMPGRSFLLSLEVYFKN